MSCMSEACCLPWSVKFRVSTAINPFLGEYTTLARVYTIKYHSSLVPSIYMLAQRHMPLITTTAITAYNTIT